MARVSSRVDPSCVGPGNGKKGARSWAAKRLGWLQKRIYYTLLLGQFYLNCFKCQLTVWILCWLGASTFCVGWWGEVSIASAASKGLLFQNPRQLIRGRTRKHVVLQIIAVLRFYWILKNTSLTFSSVNQVSIKTRRQQLLLHVEITNRLYNLRHFPP